MDDATFYFTVRHLCPCQLCQNFVDAAICSLLKEEEDQERKRKEKRKKKKEKKKLQLVIL